MWYLDESLQLVEAQVESVEAQLEQISQAVVEHDLDENAERLLLRHLETRC